MQVATRHHGLPPGQQRGFRAFLGTKRMTALAALLLAVLSYGLAGEWSRKRDINAEITRLETQVKAMEDKNASMRLAEATTSGDAMLEKEARLKLNLQKPGEQVVIVRGTAATATAPAEKAAAEPGGNPAKWWRYFTE